MNEYKERIAKAKSKDELHDITFELGQRYGFVSTEYDEGLTMCLSRMEDLFGEDWWKK